MRCRFCGQREPRPPCPVPCRHHDLHLNPTHFKSLRFGGFNGCWRYKPRGHYLYDQHEVADALRGFPAVDVFIAHNSPRGVHDKEDETHYGFEAFLTYIKEHQPTLLVHGHQHAQKKTRLGRTLIIAAYGHQLLALPEP